MLVNGILKLFLAAGENWLCISFPILESDAGTLRSAQVSAVTL